MAPLPLTVAKNKRTGFLTSVKKKIVTLKAIGEDPEILELDRLSTATGRLVEEWKKYENSHQEVLSLVMKDEVEDEQATFSDAEDNYEAAINEVNKLLKSKFRPVDDDRVQPPERAAQLAAQR